MERKSGTNRVLLGLVITLVLIATLVFLIVSKDFVGWAYHAASAGTITSLIIHQRTTADAWHGFAGLVVLDYSNNQTNWNETATGGTTTTKDMRFNCFGKSGLDLYISPMPISQLDLTNVQPATVAEVDVYIGIDPSEMISATRTFNETFTINFGGNELTGPGFRTKATGNINNTFHQVALKDGNGVIFFAANASIAIPGYDGQLHNYQIMMPVPYNQSSVTFYFFPDPITDVLGHCEEWAYAPLEGYVIDRSTNTPLQNVTVQVGEAITQTNASGGYSMLAQVGTEFILGFKLTYFDYVNFTTVVYNQTNWHNFSMVPTYNQTSPVQYGFIEGKVLDGRTRTPIDNVTVITGIYNDVTDTEGNYSLISPEGNGTMIAAIKDGFRTNVSYVDVTAFSTLQYNITLVPLPAIFGPNGTVYGKVLDFETNETLSNATVYVGSWSAQTNDTGDYILNIPSFEFFYIIATKDFYEPFVGNLSGNMSITYGSMINYDLYLNKSNLLKGLFMTPPATQQPPPEPPKPEGISNETPQLTQPGAENGTGLVIKDEQGKIAAYLSVKQIKTHIKQDSFIEQTLAFYNFQETPLTVQFEIEGDEISSIFQVAEKQLTISPNEYGEIGITMTGTKPPGVYTGKLRITGGIEAELPIEIMISKEGKIPIKTLMMKLDLLNSIVVQGDAAKYKLDLVNLLSDKSYQVNLNFYVADINGTMLTNSTKKSVTLETINSVVGQIDIPSDFAPGDYVVRAQADYLGISSTADALFTVRVPLYAYDLFGVVPVWMLATLLGMCATAVFSYQEIKRRQEAKKRFHAKLEYDLLPQEGPRSLFVGNIAETNKRAYVDMDVLTVHSIVAGSTGGGKSISAQDIIEEALLKGVAVAVFDPTAQWSGMLRKLEDKKFLEFYTQFGMDPKKDPKGFNGNIKAVKNGREIIDIFKYMKPGEIQIFTTNTLDPKDYDIFVASMIQQVFHSKLDEFRGLKYMLVFDEIHRILPKFGGSGAGFTQIERGCREFRKWGIGIVLISQVLSDFVGEIKANINTQVQMKTRDDGDLGRIKEQYGEEYIQSLVKSPVGSGMIQNSNWNRGRPYYVTFRPILHSVVRLSDDELEKYNHFNSIVEQMEFELDQLEGLKQDVFDLRLELKLAKDKIKSGNFNMVGIYLDGLSPRVVKMWDKLGKKPEKLQIKLLDASLIDEAVKKAKKEKTDTEKANSSSEAEEASPPETAPATNNKSTDTAHSVAGQAASQGKILPDSVAFQSIITNANQAIMTRDKNLAVKLYGQLTDAYKKIPAESKAAAYNQVIEINKKISMFK
jgi:hypothetical protein